MGRQHIREQVIRTIRQYGMLRKGDRVLVCVSGGPDSVCLVRELDGLRGKFGLAGVSVCHLDHGLRGAASRGDARFVRALAREKCLAVTIGRADLGRARRDGSSLEEAARKARYRFFRAAARRHGAQVIATGHTLDDQAETVLMRVLKGSSLKGVAGIHPVRKEGMFRVIRPLLGVTKSDIVRELDRDGVGYRSDASNSDTAFFRNAVRHEIMPFLERYNPRLKRSLAGLAEHAREDGAFIEEARRHAALPISRKGAAIEVRLKDIVLQPASVQKEIMRDAFGCSGGAIKKLTHRHWKDLQQLIARNGKGSSLDLPGDIRVARTGTTLRFCRRGGR